MLKNTLILPSNDDALAGQLLKDAIADLDVILMLVLGGGEVHQFVDWADQLCEKTKLSNGYNVRHVVWVQNPQLPLVQSTLLPLLVTIAPVVAVLNFYDKLMATIDDPNDIDPLALEEAFLKGGV